MFFNAFQQFIQIQKKWVKGINPDDKHIALIHGACLINFFQTDENYFKIFAEKLAASRREGAALVEVEVEVEVEEKASLSQESPSISAKEKLNTIFQNTKTRTIQRQLVDLLREYNIEFYMTPGKGDHTKLYVNGVLIVLPEHVEWKPGTKKSIQKELAEQLPEDPQ